MAPVKIKDHTKETITPLIILGIKNKERITPLHRTFESKKYAITKIILFGSRARGTHTERSDIDIAVYGGDFEHFYWDVKEKTHSLLMFDIVQADVAISDELKQEIEKDGVTIYEKA